MPTLHFFFSSSFHASKFTLAMSSTKNGIQRLSISIGCGQVFLMAFISSSIKDNFTFPSIYTSLKVTPPGILDLILNVPTIILFWLSLHLHKRLGVHHQDC